MELIEIKISKENEQDIDDDFQPIGWNYLNIVDVNTYLFYKPFPEGNAFEWMIIYETSNEQSLGKQGVFTREPDEYGQKLSFFPGQIFLGGQYSYKSFTIDYELIAQIGAHGGSTTTGDFINILYELNKLHKQFFPNHILGERTITYNI